MSSSVVALISALITAILGPISINYFQSWMKRKENKDLIKESLKTNILVENKIETIKKDFEADRVWISQFHNGGNYYPTGKSIQKFSMFYEVVSPNAESIKMNFQNIPVSLFSKSIHDLSENNTITIPDVLNQEDKHGLKYIAAENKCKSLYEFAIRNIEGRFIGIVGIEYIDEKKELTNHEVNTLALEATSIGGVLTNLLK